MQLKLYKSLDEKNRISKTLTDELILNGALRDNSSIVKPTILIQTDPLDYNYAYIPEFGRYYFINNVVAMRNKAFIVDLKCDVLMSFKEEILNMNGIVSRLTSGSPYAERDVLCSVKEEHRRIDFPESPFTKDGSYILIAKGGY